MSDTNTHQSPMGTIRKIAHLAFSLWLFVVALQLIKFSIQSPDLNILQSGTVSAFFNAPLRSFALGWFGMTIILSGSPMAAIGISLFASGIQTDPSSLAAIIYGSRAGPDLILFLIGIVTLLKGRGVRRSFMLGILEFLTTLTVVLTSALIYRLFFENYLLGEKIESLYTVSAYTSITELIVNPVADQIIVVLGALPGLIAGLGTLGIAVVLIDKFFTFGSFSSSEMRPEEHGRFTRTFYKLRFRWKMEHSGTLLKWMDMYLKRPYMAFLLGAIVTGLTLSTTISVSLILPFFAYGIISERSAIAYVLAANMTTLIDTYFISIITQNVQAQSVVLSVIASVCISSAAFLILFHPYSRLVIWMSNSIVHRPKALISIVILALVVPLPILFM